jgi:polyphosphate glucokinase
MAAVNKAPVRRPAAPRPRVAATPNTLAIDIGGTGLKASVLDPKGNMLTERVRVETTYPIDPTTMVTTLVALVKPLPAFGRISVAFPGVVRKNRILSAPHFVTVAGPGTKVDPKLQTAWHNFDLGGALTKALGKPTRVLNDADIQGLDVVSGNGLELVITLGTGLGTAVFQDGKLGPRLEFSHHPFRDGETYNEQVGDAARKKIGNKKWNRRVAKAVATLDALLFFDKVYIGGGNAERLTVDLGPKAVKIDPNAGILGGIMLWNHPDH